MAIIKKQLAKFNTMPLRLLSILMAVLILFGSIPFALRDVFANDGGFSLELRWMDTEDSSSLEYDSSRSENRLARLRVSYRNESPSSGYQPGEIVIAVTGLKGAVRGGGAVEPLAIAADKASAATQIYDWNYTYSSTTDTYTFTNNKPVNESVVLSGNFEIIWQLGSRNTVHDFDTVLTASLRTASQEQTTSNSVSYHQIRARDEYTVTHSAAALYTAEGLEAGLPAGTTAADYTFVQYTVSGSVAERARAVGGAERFELWVPAGTILQSPAHTLTRTGKTRETDGRTYECWSVTRDISAYSERPYLQWIYAAYPKTMYNGTINSYVEIKGTYYEETEETTLAEHTLPINLDEMGFKPIQGSRYYHSLTAYGMTSDYVRAHCSQCYAYGAISHEHLSSDGGSYHSDLRFGLVYSGKEDYFNVELVSDFFDMQLKDGSLQQLADDEYHYTSMVLYGTSTNLNHYPIQADTYPVDIYVRYKDQENFETTPYMTTKLLKNSQSIDLPADTVGVKIVIRELRESTVSLSENGTLFGTLPALARLNYQFHTDAAEILTDGGRFYHSVHCKLYDQAGNWFNEGNNTSSWNDGYNSSEREHKRDVEIYGSALDRARAWLHILEIPNEYRVTNTIRAASPSEDRGYFYFNSSITSTFRYMADGTLSGFSQYTILPEGVYLAENIRDPLDLLDEVFFSSNMTAINDRYIRQHCQVEIIHDYGYENSGRTYIALHYDFEDAPVKITSLTVSGIPVYADKTEIESTTKSYTMYAMALMDDTRGKWYATGKDNKTIEGGLWSDIDGDGDTEETAALSQSSVSVVNPAHGELRAAKYVSTNSTAAYAAPVKNEAGYAGDIPYEYAGYEYTYRLELAVSEGGATNIVFADALETGSDSEWQGIFQSVDYRLAQRRLGVAPTVWYSAQVENVENLNFANGSWTQTKPETVRSIALDFGTATLSENQSVSIYIRMRVPENMSDDLEGSLTENQYTAHYTLRGSEKATLTSNPVPVQYSRFRGRIDLQKYDSTDGRYVEGAEFDLYKAEDDGSDTLIGHYTTNSYGVIVVERLLYGTYYFVETKAALGYVLPDDPEARIHPAVLGEGADYPNAIEEITVYNDRKPGQFTLKKVNDRDSSIPVVGAKFSVYSEDGTPVQDGKDPQFGLVTDENGELTVNNLPWGDYYLQEIEAPPGYELNEDQISFTIAAENDAGQALAITITDPQKPASAVLTKYEIEEEGQPRTEVTLDGAVYQLYRKTAAGDQLIGNYMTNAAGKIYADDLTFGEYYFLESIAPLGYEKYPNSIPFTIDAAHTTAECEIVATDTRLKGRVWMQKLDDANSPVHGAEYGLYDAETGNLLETYTTNAEGIIEISGLLWNSYYLQETKAPTGYELSEEQYAVDVRRETVNNRFIIHATDNRGRGSVRLVKVDENNESTRLEGAVFSLYRSDGSLVQEGLTTDKNGEILVENLEWGSYYFRETKAPTGYGLNSDNIRFSVNYLTAGTEQELLVTDPEEMLDLTVTKRIDRASVVFAHGNPTFIFRLEGADIHGNSRTMYRSVAFDAAYYSQNTGDYLDLEVRFSGLMMGTYTVSEVAANRYALGSIDGVVGGIPTGDGSGVTFELEAGGTYGAVFHNGKSDQSLTGHTSLVTNIIGKERKLTSLTAMWKGDEVASETLDRSLLEVYANYDDGTSRLLGNDDYNLIPDRFDTSMNGDYTVTVTYTEGGRTRRGTFDLRLNVPAAFTWEVLSEEACEYDGKKYDGTVCITGYTGSSTVVNFPTAVKGIRTWRDDGNHVYEDNGKTYHVVQLGGKLTTAANVIKGMTNAEQIEIPEGIQTIAPYAFYINVSLVTRNNKLGGDLFIPDSVTEIGDYAFAYCRFTGTLKLGTSQTASNLQTIGDYAFSSYFPNPDDYCPQFSGDLLIPDSVTSIGAAAFYCGGFKGALKLGTSPEKSQLTTIGRLAFASHYSAINGRNPMFTGELVLPNKLTEIQISSFAYCGFTGDLVIPEGVTKIWNSAFTYCFFDGRLTLPSSLQTIAASAFQSLSDTPQFTGTLLIPEGVTEIGNFAFQYCGFTGSLHIPDSVTSIGDRAFQRVPFDGSLTLGSSQTASNLQTIGAYAFSNCGFTGDLYIPDGLNRLATYAFYACGFNGTLSLESAEGKSQLTTIGSHAFYSQNTERMFTGSLSIPDSVTSIGDYAFYLCGFDGTLTLGSSQTASNLQTIGAYAFNGCRFTGGLYIPNDTIRIGDYAFRQNYFNEELNLGNSLQTIGNAAFESYTNRPMFKGSLVIPDSMISIGVSAFYACGFDGTLTLESAPGKSQLTTIKDGAFLSHYQSEANKRPMFTGDLIIPDSVTSIGLQGFRGCGFDGTLTLGSGLTTIGWRALSSAYSAPQFSGQHLYVPDNVTDIRGEAFQNSGFASASLPGALETSEYAPFALKCVPTYRPAP